MFHRVTDCLVLIRTEKSTGSSSETGRVTDSAEKEVTDKIKQLQIYDVQNDNFTVNENSRTKTLNDPSVRMATVF